MRRRACGSGPPPWSPRSALGRRRSRRASPRLRRRFGESSWSSSAARSSAASCGLQLSASGPSRTRSIVSRSMPPSSEIRTCWPHSYEEPQRTAVRRMSSSRSRPGSLPAVSRKPPNGSQARKRSGCRAKVGKMLLSPSRLETPAGDGLEDPLQIRSPPQSSGGSGGMRGSSLIVSPWGDGQPAVHDQALAGDIARLAREQEDGGVRDLPRRPLTSGGDRDLVAQRADLGREPAERGVDQARHQQIGPDAGCAFHRGLATERLERRLGGGVDRERASPRARRSSRPARPRRRRPSTPWRACSPGTADRALTAITRSQSSTLVPARPSPAPIPAFITRPSMAAELRRRPLEGIRHRRLAARVGPDHERVRALGAHQSRRFPPRSAR